MSKIILLKECSPLCPYSTRYNDGNEDVSHGITRIACLVRDTYGFSGMYIDNMSRLSNREKRFQHNCFLKA
jgi:hypothetical protein